MSIYGLLRWTAALIVVPILLVVLFIAIFGWNWLRGPVERLTLDKTGRELTIGGDIKVSFAWPLPRITAGAVTFANPVWALEKQMVTADAIEITLNLPQLLVRKIVLPEVHLVRPVVFLEHSKNGKKNWLLDLDQQDEDARIQIDRLTLDHGRLGFDDVAQQTNIRAELTSSDASHAVLPSATATGASIVQSSGSAGELSAPTAVGITFSAQGRYKNLPLKAKGDGGPVLALRDEETPYVLNIDLSIGRSGVKAEGTITSLLKFSAIDMRLALHGDSLAQLFPLLGIALPETRAYTTKGQLVHSAQLWRYENFSGRVGDSDIAGNVLIDTSGKRPALTAELVSKVLDIADLGPLIGAQPGSLTLARAAAPSPVEAIAKPLPEAARVLPDMSFKTEHWDTVDAEVTLTAKTISRAKELPLENLSVHLSLRDEMLRLDPLDFGFAGGHLSAVISLDGQRDPIQARALVRAKRILLAKLFPTIKLTKGSSGQLNGEFNLTGQGDSVRAMLANANGKLGLVVTDGELSRLMMEKIGLHLWEILQLKISGDQLIHLRCAVADFEVKEGNMQSQAIVFDTEITTILGSGDINLGKETLDLTLKQKTKNTSPLALRSPIYIRGSFANPEVHVDERYVILRGLSAVALGIINPVLAFVPLVDPGPGKDRDCQQLASEARPKLQSQKVRAVAQQ